MKNNHIQRMILGCGAPLLFIFLTPSFGISDGTAVLIFIIAMFGAHLLIPMQHIKKTYSLLYAEI